MEYRCRLGTPSGEVVEGVYVAGPSKSKELAYEFVKFVTDVKATTIMAVEGRQTPANK